jgi:hypothetical protein
VVKHIPKVITLALFTYNIQQELLHWLYLQIKVITLALFTDNIQQELLHWLYLQIKVISLALFTDKSYYIGFIYR